MELGILKKADKKDCCYQKIVLKGNTLKGAILFGDNKPLSYVSNKMEEEVDREELKKLLELHTYKCNKCGEEYDEAKMGTLFKDLPADWKCPSCNCSKKEFIKEENY
ncbi:MAG: rubredoxin [Promethearchaeota archaeon]